MKFNIKQQQEKAKEEKKQQNNPKGELDFNKKNREDFEHLMKDSSTNLDGYWDKKNPFVQIFLFALGIVILLGIAYYALLFLSNR